MEKGKSAIKNKSITKRNSFLHSRLKAFNAITSRKPTIKNDVENDFDDNESDVFLRDIKPSKKLMGIDERFKSLKTDLKLLLGDTETETSPESFSDSKSCNALSDFNDKLEKIQFKETEIEMKNVDPNFNSTLSKVSICLDKTTFDLDNDDDDDDDDSLDSKSPPVLLSNSIVNQVKSNTSFLQHRVEELLYKSFCLQNSELFLSSPEVSAEEKSKCKKKQKTKPASTKGKQKCKSLKKQKKTFIKKPVKGDVEIINLDSSLGDNKTQDASVICVDLDVSNYNWDESFELDEGTGFLSDVQIIDEFNKKYADEEQKPMTKLTESGKNVSEDKNKKTPSRNSWECPVCFETSQGQEIVATQCGHVFCRKCIETHTSQISNNCPTCRFSLQDKALITLFNF